MIALKNCEIFTGDEFINDHALLIDGDKIHSIVPEKDLHDSFEIIDLDGNTIAPGFIDLQVNGGGGILFNDEPTVEGIKTIFEAHKKFGTTDWLPTFITGPNAGMARAAEAVNNCLKCNLHGVRGIHFEGPFLSPKKPGVHDLNNIRTPNEEDLFIMHSVRDGVSLITLAPEVASNELIAELKKAGHIISLGHSNAAYQEAMDAFAAGATGTTHLYNAMSPLTSRAPGVVGAAFDHQDSWAGIIVDGFHCDYAAVRIAWKAKPKGKLFLVTDAMPPVGTNKKSFRLGEQEIGVDNGRCSTHDGTLAGSALDMATAIRNCIKHVGVEKGEALRMASRYPAEFIGLADRIGSIKPGYDANLVVFDKDIQASAVMIQGDYLSFDY